MPPGSTLSVHLQDTWPSVCSQQYPLIGLDSFKPSSQYLCRFGHYKIILATRNVIPKHQNTKPPAIPLTFSPPLRNSLRKWPQKVQIWCRWLETINHNKINSNSLVLPCSSVHSTLLAQHQQVFETLVSIKNRQLLSLTDLIVNVISLFHNPFHILTQPLISFPHISHPSLEIPDIKSIVVIP